MRSSSDIDLVIESEVEDDSATIAVPCGSETGGALRSQRSDDGLDAGKVVSRAMTTYPLRPVEVGAKPGLEIRTSVCQSRELERVTVRTSSMTFVVTASPSKRSGIMTLKLLRAKSSASSFMNMDQD